MRRGFVFVTLIMMTENKDMGHHDRKVVIILQYTSKYLYALVQKV